MAIRLEDKGRKFKRVRQSAQEKTQLARAGFQHVLSSNVSAIAQDGNNLVIRFHGGATYSYAGAGELYKPMLRSNSKGKYVWINLIRKRVPFRKVGGVSLKSDAQFTDRDLTEVAKKPLSINLLTTLLSKDQLIQKGIIATNLARIIKGT